MSKTKTRAWTYEGIPLLMLHLALPYGYQEGIDAYYEEVAKGAVDACDRHFTAITSHLAEVGDQLQAARQGRESFSLLCKETVVGEYLFVEETYSYSAKGRETEHHSRCFRLTDGACIPLSVLLPPSKLSAYKRAGLLPKKLSSRHLSRLPFHLTKEGLSLYYSGVWYPLPLA